MNKKTLILIFILILIIAFFFRFYNLPLRPVHHDENVHYVFSGLLLEGSPHIYNPVFHGPFLYHLQYIIFSALGYSDFSLRFGPALFGVLLICLLWLMKDWLGDIGLIAAAALLAVSPSFVYFSRFFIHDSYYAFFTLLAVAAIFLHLKTRNSQYIHLLGVSLALLFATKENAYITSFIFASFVLMLYLWLVLAPKIKELFRGKKENLSKWLEQEQNHLKDFFSWIKHNKKHMIIACLLFALVFAFFYSSGFRSSQSLINGITEPVMHWVNASETWTGHHKPFTYYLKILYQFEFAVMILGLAGLYFALKKTEYSRFSRFIAYFAVVQLAIFLWLKYKTPWLVLHIALPFALLAGIAANDIYKKIKFKKIFLFAVFAVVALSAVKSCDSNFISCGKDAHLLSYVQTSDEVLDAVKDINEYAAGNSGFEMPISILSQEYYPLPWYLRGYENISYNQSIAEALEQKTPVIILNPPAKENISQDSLVNYSGKEYILLSKIEIYFLK